MTADKKSKILVVDDSPDDIRMLMAALKDEFALSAATNAEDALQLLAEQDKPDIILMDINMPGMNGYEACKIIKGTSEFAAIDVIFLSSNDSTQEVLDGFDCGAVDYLVKPFAPLILIPKIKQCLAYRATQSRLSEAAALANTIAMNAMTDTGDLGTVMNFLRASFTIKDIHALGMEACNTLSLFNLNACVYFYLEDRVCELSTEGEPSEIEKNVMQRLASSIEPIITIRSRLMLIKPHAVILIKNMPADADKASRTKDHLMILLEGIVAKLANIQDQIMVDTLLSNNINSAIKNSEQALLEMQSQQEVHKKRSIEILEAMVQKVEESFFPLGLTDAQEDQLLTIMSSAVTAALDHLHDGLEMDKKVKIIIDSLSALIRTR